MLSTTRSPPVQPRVPRTLADANPNPAQASNGSPVAAEPDVAPAGPAGASDGETRRARSRRRAHRSRLHGYAVLTVALGAFLIALAATNTARVKVNWVFGSAHVSLVWLVLGAAILGWLLGLVVTAAFHWRTRAPRRGGVSS